MIVVIRNSRMRREGFEGLKRNLAKRLRMSGRFLLDMHGNVFLDSIEGLFRRRKDNIPQANRIIPLLPIGMDNLENANGFASNRLSSLFCHFGTHVTSTALVFAEPLCSEGLHGKRMKII
jgi:hypothetical protein